MATLIAYILIAGKMHIARVPYETTKACEEARTAAFAHAVHTECKVRK